MDGQYFYQLKVLSPDGSIRKVLLQQERIAIGSRHHADITDPELFPDHAEIRYESGEWVIERNHPRAPVSFLGITISLKKMNHGDCIHLGPVQITMYRIPAEAESNPSPVRSESIKTHYVLQFLSGACKGRMLILHEGTYTLGRGSGPGRIDIPDPYISKNNTRIRLSDSDIMIEDLGSANGTRIGSGRINEARAVNTCTLTVGRTRMRVRIVSEPEGKRREDPDPTRIRHPSHYQRLRRSPPR
ncbi:FHA domain-containing protein [bacterium]|nr:FHA domain-containing protein [candidate division CSSED10-310 bacterium]